MDDYISKRLEKADKSNKNISKSKNKSLLLVPDSPPKQLIIGEDSEYEYILESEEDEEEYSDYENESTENKIFSNSFLNDNNRAEPFAFETNVLHHREGSVIQTRARNSVMAHGGKVKITEERKEDSYIHPALDKSGAFSNISAILGKHTFNNHNLLSLKDDSFAHECDELEFEHELDSLCNTSEHAYSGQRKKGSQNNNEKKTKHYYKPSVASTISEGDLDIENNVAHLKSNMAQMTKELERIRDLVMINNSNNGSRGEGKKMCITSKIVNWK